MVRQSNKFSEEALLTQSGLPISALPSSSHGSTGSRKRTYGQAISSPTITSRENSFAKMSSINNFDPSLRRSDQDSKRGKEEPRSSDSPLTFQEKCSMYLETIRGSSKPEKKHSNFLQPSIEGNELRGEELLNKSKILDSSLDTQGISDAPLDLCTSPKNSFSNSPHRQSPLHHRQSPINLLMQGHDETNKNLSSDSRTDTKIRSSPVLRLATESPPSDRDDKPKVEKKPDRKLTGRKSIDRKPSPIDLSRSTRSEELERDGFPPSLLAQFPGLRAGGSSLVSYDGRTINTPDALGKKSPSDSNNFFPSSMVMTPSPMVRTVV